MAYRTLESPADELRLLLRSGHGLILFETHEERRALRLIRAAAKSELRDSFHWSRMRGLVAVDATNRPPIDAEQTVDPVKALIHLDGHARPWAATFVDLADDLKDDRVVRAIRELAERSGERQSTLCLVAPVVSVPATLERLAVSFPMPLPDAAALERLVRRTYKRMKETREELEAELTRESLGRVVESLIGLTLDEAERLIMLVILRDGRLDVNDVEEIREQKRARVSHHGQLEVVPIHDDLNHLGGFGEVKRWLKRRQAHSQPRASEFGLVPPRGVLLLGVPGCGKSLAARLIAGEWRRPLLRMDMGALYNRFVGATEHNLREALRQAEGMAPCVLWIDEIEKACASSAGDAVDGGVSQRLFATFLWWMNDRQADVFIIATANDVSRLPPELMRKGRFDEIFFVDLPPASARKQIIEIHLRQRSQDVERFKFDLPALVNATEGFTGAEIEQAVVGALYRAFDANAGLTSQHLLDELASTRPLAITMHERIAGLRRWAADRCVQAH